MSVDIVGCSAHTQLSAARLRPHFPRELLHNREPTGGPGTQRPGAERDLGSIQAMYMSAAQPPILKSLLLSSQLYPTNRSPPGFRVIGPLYPPPTCDPSPSCLPVGNSEALFLPHCRSSRETLEIKARPHPSSPSVSGRKLQVSWPGRPKSSTSSTWCPYAFQTPTQSAATINAVVLPQDLCAGWALRLDAPPSGLCIAQFPALAVVPCPPPCHPSPQYLSACGLLCLASPAP